jgi:endonuclease YncB( thermonuclease family)
MSPISGSAKPVVANVVDGDTLDIKYEDGQERTRLLGVDTPETVHPTKPPEPYGAAASVRMKQLAPEGTPVRMGTGYENEDQYGRQLRYVNTLGNNENEDPLDVGLQLVREGLSELTTFDHPKKLQYYQALREAMKMQVGMWSSQKIQEGMTPVEVNRELAQKGGFGLWWELDALEAQEKQRYGLGDVALDPSTIDAIWTNNYRREKLDELGVSPDELEGPAGLDLFFPNQEEDLNEFVRSHQNLLTGVGSAALAGEQAQLADLAAQAIPDAFPKAQEVKDQANALKAEAAEEPGKMAQLVAELGGLGPEFAGQLGTGVPAREDQVAPGVVDVLGDVLGTSVQRIGDLPENISEGMQPTGEVNPFVAAKAGLPLDPGDPEAKAKATEAQFEAVATLGGPVSAAAGDVARKAGLGTIPSLAVEIGTGLAGGGLLTTQLAKAGQKAAKVTADIATTSSMRKAVVDMMEATDLPAREAVEATAKRNFVDLADIDLADETDILRKAEDALNERISSAIEEDLAHKAISQTDEAGDRVTYVLDEFDQRNEKLLAQVIQEGTEGLEGTKSSAGRWFNYHMPKVRELLEQGDFSGAWRRMDKLNNPLGRSKIAGGTLRQEFVKEVLYKSMTPEQRKAFFVGRAASLGINADSPLSPEVMQRFEKELGVEVDLANRTIKDRLKSEAGFIGGGRRADTALDPEEAAVIAHKDLKPEAQIGTLEREAAPVKHVLDRFAERFPQAGEAKKWMIRAKDIEERYIGRRVKRVVELTENLRRKSAYLLRGRLRSGTFKDAPGFQDEILRVFGNINETNFSKLLADTPEQWKPIFQELHDISTQKVVAYHASQVMDEKAYKVLRARVKDSMHLNSDAVGGLQAFMVETIEKMSRDTWNKKIVEHLEAVIQEGSAGRESLIRKGLKPDKLSPENYITQGEQDWLRLLQRSLTEAGSYHKALSNVRTAMALTKLPMVAVANIPQMGHNLLRARMSSVAEGLWHLHAPDWAGGARRATRMRGITDAAAVDSIFNEVQALVSGMENASWARNIVGKRYGLEFMERWLRTLTNEVGIIDQTKHLQKARSVDPALMKWAYGAEKGGMSFKVATSPGRMRAVNFVRNLRDIAGIRNYEDYQKLIKANDGDVGKMLNELREGGKLETAKKIFDYDGLENLRNASRRFIEQTQFRVGLIELPIRFNAPGATRDWVRTVGQFRTFMYKHAQEVFVDYVYREAKKGNLIPAMRFALWGGVFSQLTGEFVNNLKSYVMGWDRPGGNPIQIMVDHMFGNISTEEAWREFKNMGRWEYLPERVLDNFTAWGGFGLGSDFLSSAGSMEKLASFAAGPGLTSVTRNFISLLGLAGAAGKRALAQLGEEVEKKEATEQLKSAGVQAGKTASREIPFGVGKSIGRRLPGSRDLEEFAAPAVEQITSQAVTGGIGNVARGQARQAAISKREAEIQTGRIEPAEPQLNSQQMKIKRSLEGQFQQAVKAKDTAKINSIERAARQFGVTLDKRIDTRAQRKAIKQTVTARRARHRADFIEAFREKDFQKMNQVRAQWAQGKLGRMPWKEWVENER